MPRVGVAWAPTPNTSVNVGFAMANDVLYDNLGILSAPPQLQQTCDVVNPGQVQPCPYAANGFLAAGGLPGTPAPITSPEDARALTGGYVPNQTLPYSETWTAGVQHIFANKYTLEARYVGTRGVHLSVQTRLNRFAPVTAANSLPTFLSAPSQAYLDTLGTTLDQLGSISSIIPAYENAGFVGNITSFQPWGYSNYNGLQVSFKRNFTNGLQFQAAWTWSHTFDNSTADVFSTVLTPRRPQDFACFQCDYGTSALDRRHRVTLAATYDLPFFKNDNWFMKNVVGNWQFSPIYTFQSPEYATVQTGSDSNLNGDSASDRPALFNAAGVPNTFSDVSPLMNSAGAVVAYVADNPNSQYINAGAGVYGAVSRNTLSTPNINNWDFALLKRLNITERQQLQFIFQATNIFNHAQYVPGLISDVQSFGQAGSSVRNALLPPSLSDQFAQWNQVFTNHPRSLVLVMKYSF
jgi:hypothetical protein